MTTIQNDSGEPLRLEPIEAALECVFARFAVEDGEVCVRITDDDELRRLNSQFRGVDEPTDVLTFPAPLTAAGHAGDIAISIGFARRQAALRRVPIEEEVAMLAIHGGLHLAGFDDRTDEEREEMLAKMNEVAALCGIAVESEWSSIPHGRTD